MSMTLTLGGPATGKKFYPGRQTYVDGLVTKINQENQEAIYLLGPRRIGKTSIVQEYFRQRNEDNNDDGIYLYFYCAKVTNIIEFYDFVNEQIAKELKQSGSISKFSPLAFRLGTKYDSFKNSIRLSLKKITVKGNGVELNDPKEWEIYKDHVNKLKEEFIGLLEKFEMKRLVLGFDEVPEAIQTILKEKKETGVKEIQLWLEHFREIRQVKTVQVQMILFGSVNVKLTLEKLGLTNLVNDGNTIDVLPLALPDAQKLFWELVEGKKVEGFIQNQVAVDLFLKEKFTYCSPWAIQYFINEYLSLEEKSDLEIDMKQAYIRLFYLQNGPRYFHERLNKYYEKTDIEKVEHIIKYIVSKHIDEKKDLVDEQDLFKNFQTKYQDSKWKEFRVILDILMLDNILTRRVNNYYVQNTVEKNFWYGKLLGSYKL